MFGLEWGSIAFLVFYGAFTILFFVSAGAKLYKHLTKKKKPNLTLIQGGKGKEPYDRL